MKKKFTKKHSPFLTVIIFIVIITLLTRFFLTSVYLFPDGQGFFSYLSSMFHDGDLYFYNDYINLRIPVPLALTEKDYISNVWSFGAPFFWTPFYLIAKFFNNTPTNTAINPYSGWFWLLINFGTLLYGLVTLWLMFDSLKLLGLEKKKSAAFSILAFLGTPMCFYTLIVPGTSHGISAFAVALYLWYWLKSMDYPEQIYRYVLLGIFAGFMTMIRPQEGLFIICLGCEWIYRYTQKKSSLINLTKQISVFSISFLVALSPQLLIWKFIYGSYFAAPKGFNVSWSNFAFLEVLFSSYHGIFFWTPLFFIAFIGLSLFLRKNLLICGSLLLVLLSQVLINSFCVAWWAGHSFGLRSMTSSAFLTAVGIGLFWQKNNSNKQLWKSVVLGLIIISAVWTTTLCIHSYMGFNLIDYFTPKELLQTQLTMPSVSLKAINQLVSHSHPNFGTSLFLIIIASIFMLILKTLKKLIDKKRLILVAGFLFTVILLMNIKIFLAHLNKPSYDLNKTKLINHKEFQQFFINQADEYKSKYLKKRDKLK